MKKRNQDHDRTDKMQIEIVAAKGQDRVIEAYETQGKDKDHRCTDRGRIMKQAHPAVIGESLIDQAIDRKRYQHDRNDKTVAAGDDREISEKLKGDPFLSKHDDTAINRDQIEYGADDCCQQSQNASSSVEIN